MSKDLGNGEFEHVIVSEVETKQVDDLVYKNQVDTGGLCTVNVGQQLNTSITFVVTFYSDVNYSSNTVGDTDVYNKQYVYNST
jgi:hypothetical protein